MQRCAPASGLSHSPSHAKTEKLAALRLWARARCGGASGREGGHDFALQLPKARAGTGRCEGETGTSRVGGGPSVPGPSQARLSMAHPDPEGASLERCCSPREPVLHSPEHHCVCPALSELESGVRRCPRKKEGGAVERVVCQAAPHNFLGMLFVRIFVGLFVSRRQPLKPRRAR